MTAPDVGLRERKKQATRTALHEATLALMTEAAPQAVTVEAICAEAGVSRRTFFNYFDSKEEALFLWNEEHARRITETTRDHAPGAAPFVAAREAVRGMFHNTVANKNRAPLQRLLAAHPELVSAGLRVSRALEHALAQGVAARAGRAVDDVSVQAVAAAVSGAVRVISNNWPADPEADIDALIDEAFIPLIRAAQQR